MSKKLTDAQHNYRMFEQETLAILKALLKWEDKLLGFPFKIITNHEALKYLHATKTVEPTDPMDGLPVPIQCRNRLHERS